MRYLVLSALLLCPSGAQASATSVATVDAVALQTIDGQSVHLADPAFAGKVLLIVNTASQCGYTPQLGGLQALHARFAARGFAVLGFPSNDFGGQEPGSNAEIQRFCANKFQVQFPLFAKAPVKGKDTQPLYRALLAQSTEPAEPAWNFEKFLLGRDHRVRARFKSATAPDSAALLGAIEAALTPKR